MDYECLDALIYELEDLCGLAVSGHRRWGEVWEHVRTIGQAFKETRYPTRADKDDAWAHFQRVVDDIKVRERWQRHETETLSSQHRDEVLRHAYQARTCYEEHPFVDMLLPRLNDRREELQAASRHLREAWNQWSERKGEMLGRDRKEVFAELRQIQDGLDLCWDEYRKARSEARYAHADRVEERIEKLKERLSEQYDRKDKCEQNISKLKDMLYNARGDAFRDKVDGWLRDAEDRLRSIEDKIANLERWLDEERDRLDRLR